MYMRFKPNNEYYYDFNPMRSQIIISDEDEKHTISDKNENLILTFILY